MNTGHMKIKSLNAHQHGLLPLISYESKKTRILILIQICFYLCTRRQCLEATPWIVAFLTMHVLISDTSSSSQLHFRISVVLKITPILNNLSWTQWVRISKGRARESILLHGFSRDSSIQPYMHFDSRPQGQMDSGSHDRSVSLGGALTEFPQSLISPWLSPVACSMYFQLVPTEEQF